MGWYTDWFVADIADADAIASIVTDERDFDDWPHLGLKNIGELELSLLWGAIRGDLDAPPDPAGTLLHQREDEDGGGILVFTVAPEFVTALAQLPADQQQRLAVTWHSTAAVCFEPEC
jgi:hypothetical protein